LGINFGIPGYLTAEVVLFGTIEDGQRLVSSYFDASAM